MEIQLSDFEKQAINSFMSNRVMLEAVKKVMLAGIYSQGVQEKEKASDPQKNFMLKIALSGGTDERVGQDCKASAIAVQLLESGFKKLDTYRQQVVEPTPNLQIAT